VKRLGFTLLELLTVIAIIAVIAAIAVPTLDKFKPNYSATATRQLLDDIGRARQLAIGQRTTVYMVFVPAGFWADPAFNPAWSYANPSRSTNLFDKQLVAYNYVTLRSLGDQPGRWTVHYLDSWKALPDGSFIDPVKFNRAFNRFNPLVLYTNNLNGNPVPALQYTSFAYTNIIPFPSEDAPQAGARKWPLVPYLAFDFMGQLVSGDPAFPEVIPLSKGSVGVPRGPDKQPIATLLSYNEQPPGNGTNSVTYNLIYIDRLTGRARSIHQEVR
jgi:prepilin-type N-terminal cleavage/methylation domain-containing protein